MREHPILYRCLIISPADVTIERDAVEDALLKWNAHVGAQRGVRIEAVRWESHARPTVALPAQAAINQQLVDSCHFGIAIFWSRLGSPTVGYPSGSVEEIERLSSLKRDVMVYLCERDIPQTQLVDDQFRRLQEVKQHYKTQSLLGTYRSIEELREQVILHVSALVTKLLESNAPVRTTNALDTAPKPDVRLRPIWHRQLLDDVVCELIEFRIENHSPNTVFIERFELRLDSFDVVEVRLDCMTGEAPLPARLESGTRATIHVNDSYLGQLYPRCKVIEVVAFDQIGRTYRTDAGAIAAAKLDWLWFTGQLEA